MNTPLRVGTVPYSNSYPLDWFLQPCLPSGSTVVRRPPSRLGHDLASGSLDVALLSTIELARHPEYESIPGMGVCSHGPVASVLLFSRCDPAEIRTLALDANSLTSVMLVRILLREYWQNTPAFLPFTPPLHHGLEQADAALTIGDNSFVAAPPGIFVYDLGDIWYEWTGLPFVYAMWITRPGTDAEALAPAFRQSLDQGLARREELAEQCARKGIRSATFYQHYLTENIQYRVEERELQGMNFFLEKAASWLQSGTD